MPARNRAKEAKRRERRGQGNGADLWHRCEVRSPGEQRAHGYYREEHVFGHGCPLCWRERQEAADDIAAARMRGD